MQITITTVGRAALVNAQNNGTLPVVLTEVGVTAQAFSPDASMTALPGEIKRLTTFAGQVVADDTMHVTIRDDSGDSYSMHGFGIYIADGTLFAVYGQAGVILEKSAQAMLLLAADVRFQQIDATNLSFGETNWINPPATESVQGVVELATNAEASSGADTQRAVTPAGVKYTLDQRIGANAPSTFAKSLLLAADEADVRESLSIKSAALRDEGAGNGLDADLLDGKDGAFYREWDNILDKPTSFPSALSGALVMPSSNLGAPDGTSNFLFFGTAIYDTSSIFSTQSPTRLTAPKTGYVRVSCQTQLLSPVSTAGSLQLRVFLNSNLGLSPDGRMLVVDRHDTVNGVVGLPVLKVSTPPIHVNQGDYFEIQFTPDVRADVALAGSATWATLEVLS